jgi:hypothetical protein
LSILFLVAPSVVKAEKFGETYMRILLPQNSAERLSEDRFSPQFTVWTTVTIDTSAKWRAAPPTGFLTQPEIH